MTTLYLIRGIPGSGKSTLGNFLAGSGTVFAAIEADDYFVKDGLYVFDANKLHEAHHWCQTKVDKLLEFGYSVAVTNTSTIESAWRC